MDRPETGEAGIADTGAEHGTWTLKINKVGPRHVCVCSFPSHKASRNRVTQTWQSILATVGPEKCEEPSQTVFLYHIHAHLPRIPIMSDSPAP